MYGLLKRFCCQHALEIVTIVVLHDCIVDCSETFIERPTSLVARAPTYSNYKSHITMKYLVAISPTGAIIFCQSAGVDGSRISICITAFWISLNTMIMSWQTEVFR